MPERRKPPVESSSHSGARSDSASLPDEPLAFSIETTTMRLKSLRLRRAEAETMEVDAAVKAAIARDREAAEVPPDGPSGRIRHDERGVAVWDWAVATGEFSTLSTTRALKKLEVADLKIEDQKAAAPKLGNTGRDKAGGFDPYNQRGSGQREGEAAQRAGVTGSPTRGPVLDQLTGKKK